jgi:hypothetical protein
MKKLCYAIVGINIILLLSSSAYPQTGRIQQNILPHGNKIHKAEIFNFSKYLFGPQSTLELFVVSVDTASGTVEINGGDTQCPTTPFIWNWGDGFTEDGFFPGSHTYLDKTINYNVSVISTYSGGKHDTAEVLVRFVPPSITPIALSPIVAVHVPDTAITLGTRLYSPPTHLVGFADSFFRAIPRSTLEYILSVAAAEEREFVNDNMYLFDSKFEEFMLRDTLFGGAYSLWFTDPVAFGAGDGFIQGTIDYSSLFHEMGHNFTLNTPNDFYYGGRIDGNANAIYSESMTQIFQHAAGYEVVNNYLSYGLSEDLMLEIKQRISQTIKLVRSSYENYLSAGKPYTSWNNPSTPEDETFGTFMTIAYKFCEHAENAGLGYREPLKRMMILLQEFNDDWAQRYDQGNNTADADTFRATLMVTALSYAFSTDLRDEFRLLNFPISDQIYTELIETPVPIQLASFTGSFVLPNLVRLDWQTVSEINNYGFEVQRKPASQVEFETLPNSFVAGHGTTLEPHDYSFVDSTVSVGSWLYRLKQIDLDGSVHFSSIVFVDVLTSVADEKLPTIFALYQNYPNPFNPTTVIRYQLPNVGREAFSTYKVSLKIYNLLGQEVVTLVNENKHAGEYTIQWNAEGLTSGVYFCRLQSEKYMETKKLLLLR